MSTHKDMDVNCNQRPVALIFCGMSGAAMPTQFGNMGYLGNKVGEWATPNFLVVEVTCLL